jgi:tetraacyldisaccharide 4'-kinase
VNLQSIIRVMSGSARGIMPTLLRAGLSAAEPFYAGAMMVRNRFYDNNWRGARKLDRPVISIGNITTGGTGKTPMVRWLAEQLRTDGRRVAILSRGYRAAGPQLGDELEMLDRSLNDGSRPAVLLAANPDRAGAGARLLAEHPEIDVFLLDDGFQHRRLARDFDLVLVSAAEPFGFGHVLPRGLLREPLSGLGRASAVVITHADQTRSADLNRIESVIHRYQPGLPVYRAVHVQTELRSPSCERHPIGILARRPFFAFCGIANPSPFDSQLKRFGASYVGHRWFNDHHHYTASDLAALREAATRAGAELLITTEKDGSKILPSATAAPEIWRVDMSIRFLDGAESRLLADLRRIVLANITERDPAARKKRLHGGG